MRLFFFVLIALALIGCGAPPAPSSAPIDAAPPPAADGNQRLDRQVVPSAYALDLTINPDAGTLSGTAEIKITLARPSRDIVLHAQDLALEAPQVRSAGQTQTGTAHPGTHGGLTLRFPQPVRAGTATLLLRWTAAIGAQPRGLYRVKDGERWYAFTQFQPLDARRAFPCFDQPEFKTPYRTTLRVPPGTLGLSNSKETGRTDGSDHTVFTFAETQPLPTYLVAMAVGPFDVATAPPDALGGPDAPPLRVITTQGKGVLAGYALARTPLIHQALVRYFGHPHGFDKLDLVAVPEFAAGAMENVGLVTFREALLLLDGKTAPARRRLWAQTVIAHELAHMWFGNRVTLAWWDDLWLNEAFASWMATRIVAAVDPGLEVELEDVANARWVMNLDSTAHTRAIRQPIRNGGDVENAFDGITYGKGAAVLRMTEAWLGADVFQRGVQAYMNAHAGGNAVTQDLLDALKAASGKDVGAMLQRFLDQPGVPLITADLDCDAKRLTLSQQRYLPAGSTAPQGKPWTVPVCMRLGTGSGSTVRCELLDAPQKTVPLTDCPAWLLPNADQRGYYLWRLTRGGQPADLAQTYTAHRAALSDAERAALPGGLWSMINADALPVDRFLDLHGALAGDPHRVVVQGAISGLARLDSVLVDDADRARWATWIRAALAPHFKRLGTVARSDEPVADTLLRRRIMDAQVHLGADPALRAQAQEIARRFFKDPRSVPQAQISQALPVAAATADAAAWTRLKTALGEAHDPITRNAIVQALASVDDPKLYTRTLNLLLDGTLRAQDFRSVLRGADRHTRAAAWRWLTAHYAAIVERVGPAMAPRLPFVASGMCTPAARAEVAAFFADPAHAPDGTAANLGLTLASIDDCVRLKAALSADFKRWLAKRAP